MPIFAYADPIHFRRWYPNIKQLGLGRTTGKGYWGAPGSDVKGNRGGNSYSRYGAEGKGLGDIAQHAYNASRRSKLTSGVDRAMFDRIVMTFRSGGSDMFKGMYQLPGSPKYGGGAGSFEPPTEVQQEAAIQAYKTQVSRAQERAKAASNQFGAITTGRSRGYPSWVMNMLKGANTELGKPPKTGGSNMPMGLALIALKVLL